MGAAQFVLGDAYEHVRLQVERLAADARLLLIARVQGFDEQGDIQGDPLPLGFVGIRDRIRPTATETIAYFKDQGVRVLVISGDDSQPFRVSQRRWGWKARNASLTQPR